MFRIGLFQQCFVRFCLFQKSKRVLLVGLEIAEGKYLAEISFSTLVIVIISCKYS